MEFDIDTEGKLTIGAAALVLLVLSMFGGAALFDGSADTYYCEATQLVAKCDSLSSTSKSCYYIDGDGDKRSKRCLTAPYWVGVVNDIVVEKEVVTEVQVIKEVEVVKEVEVIKEVFIYEENPYPTGKQWTCNQEGCVKIK